MLQLRCEAHADLEGICHDTERCGNRHSTALMSLKSYGYIYSTTNPEQTEGMTSGLPDWGYGCNLTEPIPHKNHPFIAIIILRGANNWYFEYQECQGIIRKTMASMAAPMSSQEVA